MHHFKWQFFVKETIYFSFKQFWFLGQNHGQFHSPNSIFPICCIVVFSCSIVYFLFARFVSFDSFFYSFFIFCLFFFIIFSHTLETTSKCTIQKEWRDYDKRRNVWLIATGYCCVSFWQHLLQNCEKRFISGMFLLLFFDFFGIIPEYRLDNRQPSVWITQWSLDNSAKKRLQFIHFFHWSISIFENWIEFSHFIETENKRDAIACGMCAMTNEMNNFIQNREIVHCNP